VQFLTCKVNHIELCSMDLGDHSLSMCLFFFLRLGSFSLYVPMMMTICAGSFSCSDSGSVHLLRQHYVLHYIGASDRFILLVGSLCIPVNIASENSVNCCEMMLE